MIVNPLIKKEKSEIFLAVNPNVSKSKEAQPQLPLQAK
jgi:hypothetical protein